MHSRELGSRFWLRDPSPVSASRELGRCPLRRSLLQPSDGRDHGQLVLVPSLPFSGAAVPVHSCWAAAAVTHVFPENRDPSSRWLRTSHWWEQKSSGNEEALINRSPHSQNNPNSLILSKRPKSVQYLLLISFIWYQNFESFKWCFPPLYESLKGSYY